MRLKQFRLYLVRLYVSIGFFFYYKKIGVKGQEFVPDNKPVLILSNHQNALIDPLLIATKSGRFCYYLTRAAIFKNPLLAKVLKGVQMLPVYRARDGWQAIAKNNAIFETCKGLLKDHEALVVFPEGSHSLKRNVRPLSKGFTRIILDTLETYPDLDLQLLPVGVNYRNAKEFGDSALLNIGKPIAAKRYMHLEKTEAVKALKQDIQKEIQLLTTHITVDYEEVSMILDDVQADYLNPEAINHYIEHNEKRPDFKYKTSVLEPFGLVFKLFLKVVLLPVYVLWKLVLQPQIKEKEFTTTFRYGVGLTLVPIWLLIVLLVIGVNFGWAIAFGSLLGILGIALLAVKL
ncbi:lysophospholipid acyltransferase family protein [Formosa sp. PL04]|uniref:lysophospholipid acyltransferase family protein n=1 Tax=Formosa sp. PL04 TaxID=3081755 RepID=UPI002981D509|nr:lysophospholipid acyltransferase family protein [Formosa sp. PL04]MDW5289350.1 lysophospholipid acyltransferase family protein [Formosa sp. PL04]